MGRVGSSIVQWLRHRDTSLPPGVFVIIVGTLLFIWITASFQHGATQKFDESVLRALRRKDNPAAIIGPAWMHETVRDFTALGSFPVLALVTFATAGFLLLDRKFAVSIFLLVAVIGGQTVSQLLKGWINRPRPGVVPHLSLAVSASFPSGHSMMAAVVYLTLGALLTRLVTNVHVKFYFLFLAVVLTVLVGVSRVYIGVHYPTDVLSGWVGGTVWATLCWLTARALQRRGQIESEL